MKLAQIEKMKFRNVIFQNLYWVKGGITYYSSQPNKWQFAVSQIYQSITCFFCFETFEVDLEVSESFNGHNGEIYDCIVCCNPNKIEYDIYDGKISSISVGDGNEWQGSS